MKYGREETLVELVANVVRCADQMMENVLYLHERIEQNLSEDRGDVLGWHDGKPLYERKGRVVENGAVVHDSFQDIDMSPLYDAYDLEMPVETQTAA